MSKEGIVRPRVGVAVFVFRDGKFLMGQRKGSHGANTWSVPGGWLEYQESFEDAATREVKEETALDITNVRFGGITNNLIKDESVHSITIWMLSDWYSGKATITEPDKFVDQQWVTFDTLPEPLFFPWTEFLQSEFLPSIQTQLAQTMRRTM